MTQAWKPYWEPTARAVENKIRDIVQDLEDLGCEVTEVQDSILVKPPKWPSIGHSDDLTL